jgi:catechol 2,3-dioxygenase-like lactoylglutathione lyase family enzyme
VEADVTALDVGVVVHDIDAALAFYRDLLGIPVEGTNPVPGGGTMHRLRVGESLLKLVHPADAPAEGPKGDTFGHSGIRYLTITVDDVDGLVVACNAAGHPTLLGPLQMGSFRVAMVEDPEGNQVEFIGRYS